MLRPADRTFVYGAECPVHRLMLSEPKLTSVEALAELRTAHAGMTGSVEALECREAWELVKVRVQPPVGEWRSRPFEGDVAKTPSQA